MYFSLNSPRTIFIPDCFIAFKLNEKFVEMKDVKKAEKNLKDKLMKIIEKETLDLNDFISIKKEISKSDTSLAEKLYNELNNELDKINSIKELIKIAEKKNIQIYQMKMADDKYELTTQEYTKSK